MSRLSEESLPAAVLAYALPHFLQALRPAFLGCDAEGRVRRIGGALAHYGLAELAIGELATTQLPLLEGLLPHCGPELTLAAVHFSNGRCADVHLFGDDTASWVVLLDASREHAEKQAMQQKGNELSLRNERQALVLDAYLGKSVAEQVLAGRWGRNLASERREVTVLFADIREFTPFSEQSSPEQVFGTLNQYLPLMIEPIESHGGIVEHVAGDAIMAVFGMDDEPQVAAVQAVRAGLAIQAGTLASNLRRTAAGETSLGIGVGITSGPVAIGIIGTLARRGFAAIGHHVNLSSRLQGQARAGEIIVDEHTHALWLAAQVHAPDAEPPQFTSRLVTLKGVRDSQQVYVTQVP